MMRCLHDRMGNILMCVTIYDPFASNLGIDENCNQLDHPWVIIVPLTLFLYSESYLWMPNFSVLSYTNCIHIVTTADSDRWKWSSESNIA